MPVISKEFAWHRHGMGDEDRYLLARDTENRRVFIVHQWSHRRGQATASGTTEVELGTFLAVGGMAQDRLRTLIGTLIVE
jgi:hypothetical protein